MTLFVEELGNDGQPYLMAEFVLTRSYDLYDALGDGRSAAGEPGERLTGSTPEFPARGLPPLMSAGVTERLFTAVLDADSPLRAFWRGEAAASDPRRTPEREVTLRGLYPYGAAIPSDHASVAIPLVRRWEFRTPSWLTVEEALTTISANDLDRPDADRLKTAFVRWLEAVRDSPMRLVFVFDD